MTTYPLPSDPVSALSRPDASTEAHSIDHGRIIGIHENVMHYGAVGDNTADDTAAIQAAFDAIDASGTGTGGTVFFPPGNYKITSTINVNAPGSPRVATLSAIGAGAGSTRLTWAGAAGGTMMKVTALVAAGTNNGGTVRGFDFYGANLAHTLLEVDDCGVFTVADCYFGRTDTGGYAIHSQGGGVVSGWLLGNIKRNHFGLTGTVGYGVYHSSGTTLNIERNEFVDTSIASVYAAGIGGTRIHNNVFEGINVYANAVSISVKSRASIFANYFEDAALPSNRCILVRDTGGEIVIAHNELSVLNGNDYQIEIGTGCASVDISHNYAVGVAAVANVKVGTGSTDIRVFSNGNFGATPVEDNTINGVTIGWTSSVGGLSKLKIGSFANGGTLKGYLAVRSTAWDPGTIATGSSASTDITVTDALAGDTVMIAPDKDQYNPPDGAFYVGHVKDDLGTVRVTLYNFTGGNITPGSHRVGIDVIRRSRVLL